MFPTTLSYPFCGPMSDMTGYKPDGPPRTVPSDPLDGALAAVSGVSPFPTRRSILMPDPGPEPTGRPMPQEPSPLRAHRLACHRSVTFASLRLEP